MIFFSILTVILLLALALERYLHTRARHRIPILVHVNGIRGKSSVTRLIAAGLREDGIKTWAKVTGTLPNIVDERGEELPIVRHSAASIGEQRAVIAEASTRGVQALVIECMAVQPMYQRISEEGIMQSTIGVITNIRADHLEVFGTSPESIAHALANTIPQGGVLFTAEGPLLDILCLEAQKRTTRVIQVNANLVEDSWMHQFSYYEHKENVALALAVCEYLGVDRDVALQGMTRCNPDPGALRVVDLQRGGKTLHFINALAANDPQSTHQLYRRLVEEGPWQCSRLVVVNTRRDRPLRSRQIGLLLPRLAADRFYILGDGARVVQKMALAAGLEDDRLSLVRVRHVEHLVEELLAETDREAAVFAMGNTAGMGLALARYFDQLGV